MSLKFKSPAMRAIHKQTKSLAIPIQPTTGKKPQCLADLPLSFFDIQQRFGKHGLEEQASMATTRQKIEII